MKQKGKFLLLDIGEFTSWLKGLEVKRKIKLIQQHHTYVPGYTHFRKKPDHFAWMESMESSHKARGFAMIGQQLTTFPDGLICIGRPFDKVPAGIKGANEFGICMEHLGNFDAGGDEMTEGHKTTIIRVTAELCKKFNLPPNLETIVYHHWYNLTTGERGEFGAQETKTCPGGNFFGGNTTADCQNTFIPLIQKALMQ